MAITGFDVPVEPCSAEGELTGLGPKLEANSIKFGGL